MNPVDRHRYTDCLAKILWSSTRAQTMEPGFIDPQTCRYVAGIFFWKMDPRLSRGLCTPHLFCGIMCMCSWVDEYVHVWVYFKRIIIWDLLMLFSACLYVGVWVDAWGGWGCGCGWVNISECGCDVHNFCTPPKNTCLISDIILKKRSIQWERVNCRGSWSGLHWKYSPISDINQDRYISPFTLTMVDVLPFSMPPFTHSRIWIPPVSQ